MKETTSYIAIIASLVVITAALCLPFCQSARASEPVPVEKAAADHARTAEKSGARILTSLQGLGKSARGLSQRVVVRLEPAKKAIEAKVPEILEADARRVEATADATVKVVEAAAAAIEAVR